MTSQTPQVSDRCYRSPAALVGGVALLAIAGWLGVDVALRGSGLQPLAAGAGLLLFVPLVVAFTLRPAVFAGRERLRVRNPFRTITIPWPAVDSLRAGYTTEVVAESRSYQLWSVPVSLRARKAAIRHNARVQAGYKPSRGLFGMGLTESVTGEAGEKQAASDNVIAELRQLAERYGADGPDAAPEQPVTVRWAYEILVPALLGAVAVAYFLFT